MNNIFNGLTTINLEDFRKQMSRNEKIEHTQYVFDNYFYFLQQYSIFHSVHTTTVFNYPFQYFFLKDKKLIFTRDRNIDFDLDMSNAFQHLDMPCSSQGELEKNLIHALKTLLASMTKLQFYLNEYLSKYGTPFPLNAFIYHNGNLYHAVNENIQLFNATTYKDWKYYFPYYRRPDKSLIKELIKDAETSYKLRSDECLPFFILRQNYTDTYLTINNADNSILKLQEQKLPQEHKIRNFFRVNNLAIDITNFANRTFDFTPDIAAFLYYLTGGNLHTLQNFCILIYELYTYGIHNDLFLVKGCLNDNVDTNLFAQLLSLLGVGEYLSFYNSLNKFISNKSLKLIAHSSFLPIQGYFLNSPGCLNNIEKHKLFKKLVVGKKIEIKDSVVQNIKINNTLPIIYFANSHREIVYIENNFKYRDIDLSTSNFRMFIDILNRNPDEAFGISLIYYLYFLGMLFSTQSNRTTKKRVYAVPHDQILNNFAKLCLVKCPETDFLYADELYDAYCHYFKKNYAAEPLKRCQMVNKFKLLGTYLYKRPHKSRTEQNKYAFCGMNLKKNWKELIESTANSIHSFDKEAFEKELNNLISELPKLTL